MDRNEIRKQFDLRIRRFGSVRRSLRNAALFFTAGSLALLIGVASLLLLCGWTANPFVNVGLTLVASGALLVLLVRSILRWDRRRSVLSEAFRIEELAGDLYSRLISAVDFLQHDDVTPMKEAVIAAAQQDLARPFEQLLDRSARNRWGKWFALLLVGFLALGLFSPFGFARLGRTVSSSTLDLRERVFPTRYVLVPGAGRHVYRVGTNVVAGIRFTRFGYPEVTMLSALTGREGVEQSKLPVDAARQAGKTLQSALAGEYEVRFRFGRRVTEPMQLIFAMPPVIENMQTELTYPAYTRMVPKELDGLQDRVTALPGTRVSMGFTFSKPLSWAVLTFEDGERIPLDVAGRFASLSFMHAQERRAKLQVEDVHGFALEMPYALELSLAVDKSPKLIVPPYLKQDMPCPVGALNSYGFGVRAEDDYGVAKCVLRWQKANTDDRNRVQDKGEVERPLLPSKILAIVPFERIFQEQSGKPGDIYSFQIEAFDNRLPKAQSTVSAWFSIFLHADDLENGSMGGAIERPFDDTRGPKGTKQYGRGEGKPNIGVGLPSSVAKPEQKVSDYKRDDQNVTRAPTRGDDARTRSGYTSATAGGGK
jgi:hypothetical protein